MSKYGHYSSHVADLLFAIKNFIPSLESTVFFFLVGKSTDLSRGIFEKFRIFIELRCRKSATTTKKNIVTLSTLDRYIVLRDGSAPSMNTIFSMMLDIVGESVYLLSDTVSGNIFIVNTINKDSVNVVATSTTTLLSTNNKNPSTSQYSIFFD